MGPLGGGLLWVSGGGCHDSIASALSGTAVGTQGTPAAGLLLLLLLLLAILLLVCCGG